MKKLLLGAFCAASLGSVHASLFSFDFPGGFGDGGEEVPPNGSIATVMANGISYDDVSNLLVVSAMYHDLSGPITASHVHGRSDDSLLGAPGSNAGVNFNLVNSGSTTGTLTGSKTLSAQEEINLLAGRWYVNVHTTLNPGGEARGQLIPSPVPEPEEYAAIAGAGLLALGVFRRLRQPRTPSAL